MDYGRYIHSSHTTNPRSGTGVQLVGDSHGINRDYITEDTELPSIPEESEYTESGKPGCVITDRTISIFGLP